MCSLERSLAVASEIIAKFHREIQNGTWKKCYRLISFENNQIKEKSVTVLMLEQIQAQRGCELQKKQTKESERKTGHILILYTHTHTHAQQTTWHHDNCLVSQMRTSKPTENEFVADLSLEWRFAAPRECLLSKVSLCLFSTPL